MTKNDRLVGRPAHFPLYCAICGIIGADTTGWVWPAHGRREEGQRAPVHERCLNGGIDKDDLETFSDEG